MATITVSPANLAKRIRADMQARQQRVVMATKQAALEGARIVRANEPEAFGDLRGSTKAETDGKKGGRIVASAPHAAAIENGSRPHWVPLEALVRWVKLRGMQSTIHGPHQGSTSFEHANRIGRQLQSARRDFAWLATPVDAALEIARAIQHAIAKRGTRPHHYALRSLPGIRALLRAHVNASLPDR
jgi:hypothetical protein